VVFDVRVYEIVVGRKLAEGGNLGWSTLGGEAVYE